VDSRFPAFVAVLIKNQLRRIINLIFLCHVVLAFTNLTDQSQHLSRTGFCHVIILAVLFLVGNARHIYKSRRIPVLKLVARRPRTGFLGRIQDNR